MLGIGKYFPMKSDIAKAYDAPFPTPAYKMGIRAMPMQVPIIPDHSLWKLKEKQEKFSSIGKSLF